jgi:hypothetical protein
MLVLTVIALVFALVGCALGIQAFEQFSVRRWGHRFFTIGTTLSSAFAIASYAGGRAWWLAAREQRGDVSNGYVLMALGITVAVVLIVRSVWRTGLLVGALGSVLQAVVFGLMCTVGLVFVPVAILLGCVSVMAVGSATPVYIARRW